MCLLSVPLHVLFHPPGLLFLPYSSNFALLTPKESSLLQRGLPELLAQSSSVGSARSVYAPGIVICTWCLLGCISSPSLLESIYVSVSE
ncbi:hypothetical protein J1605_021925 [Eschrichtius robustus]|uniref:Uncharacterized protein n=1 Tax=Eschrichtius robustus TaxID=9764 RepID=A0AB34HBK5_ESCRO|nr:hypothetical protein J1605_021925 [Eschrichtius robustus]